MVAKTSILKELETIYEKSGNQLYVLYGRTDSEKEQLLKAFLSNKKYFYYRSRQASGQEQRNKMEAEIRQSTAMTNFLTGSKVEMRQNLWL